MSEVNQYRVLWTGINGMPGVSTFYSEGSAAPLLAKLKTFFEAAKGAIPAGITITYPGQGNVINVQTGQATAQWASPAPALTLTTGTGSFAPPTGVVLNWNTSVFSGGRQLRGKTFIVPTIGSTWQSDGKMTLAAITNWQTWGNGLAGGTDPFVVWSRHQGVTGVVSTCQVPNKAVVLRSRRD